MKTYKLYDMIWSMRTEHNVDEIDILFRLVSERDELLKAIDGYNIYLERSN